MNTESPASRHTWTNPSVVRFCVAADPVDTMIERARAVVLDAKDRGWSGPPFDPLALAELLNIKVVPREDVDDARTVPVQGGEILVEFNPNRPRGRLRYSVAHEIAHTFFPDCAERVRHRVKRERMQGDEWQLEMLCNLGAAELLMPVGSFPGLKGESLNVDRLMALRKEFDVSTEAIFLRAVRLTDQACAMFAASRRDDEPGGAYDVDYAITSRAWTWELPRGLRLPDHSVVAECAAIGFTAKGDEEWPGIQGRLHVECVGTPPYPGCRYPRVVGIATLLRRTSGSVRQIEYLRGDATAPRGKGQRIIAHVVNDKTPTWGAGFALAVRKKWPSVQEDFQHWAGADAQNLALGNTHLSQVETNLSVFHIVSQHGYGPSAKPRIRYQALHKGLLQLARAAGDRAASVHMPRIGCGEAGGEWAIVSELVDESLCKRGFDVTVYDLPNSSGPKPPTQPRLF